MTKVLRIWNGYVLLVEKCIRQLTNIFQHGKTMKTQLNGNIASKPTVQVANLISNENDMAEENVGPSNHNPNTVKYSYYIQFLKNKIENNNWNTTKYCETSSHTYLLSWDLKDKEQFEAFLCETLLTGLVTSDNILAFRCYSQAVEYLGRLKQMGVATAFYCDYVSVLKLKIEDIINGA